MAKQRKHDMEELAQQQADPKKIAEVLKLAQEMYNLQRETGQMMVLLKAKEDRLDVLETTLVPEAMSAAGMSEHQLGDSGWSVEVEQIVRASIPSETAIEKTDGPERELLVNRRTEAMKWLRENNADSLIKNKVVAEFGKGQDKAAEDWAEKINKAGYPAQRTESVHPQTLNKFLKEEIEKGKQVPTETFALFNGKRAKLTPPKKVR